LGRKPAWLYSGNNDEAAQPLELVYSSELPMFSHKEQVEKKWYEY
jgi:hypothetical protein